jgi:cation diffusion facilitator family transporter
VTDTRRAPITAERASKLRRFASRITFVAAVLLLVVKMTAWLATGSVALLSSTVDGLVDVVTSFTTFRAVRLAERPPDRGHRFGYGKAEALAGFTQSRFLYGGALVLAFQSVERLVFPDPVKQIGFGLWVIIASLLAAAGLVILQTWVMRQTRSTAIAADRANYLADVAVNLAVLAALGIIRFTGWERVDPAFALVIAGYMFWNSRGIDTDVLKQLLDRELPPEERKRIEDRVMACPGVRGLHDLRTRDSGDRTFVEFHMEVDANLTITQGHAISDAAENAVRDLFLPQVVEVISHLEPAGIEDERLDNRVG